MPISEDFSLLVNGESQQLLVADIPSSLEAETTMPIIGTGPGVERETSIVG